MLIALIANLQNQPQPQPAKLPVVKIDRGGGGQSWPYYEIVDIVAAAATFMEISGEDPVARAVRRHRWIGQALPLVKEAREKREAVAFLAGATLADAAAEERHAAQNKLRIEQIVEIIDDVRGAAAAVATPPAVTVAKVQPERGDRADRAAGTDGGIGLFIGGLVVGGLLVGIALAKRAPRRDFGFRRAHVR